MNGMVVKLFFACHMEGKVCTINEVYNTYYRLEEDTEHWCWTDEMLEDISKFNVGDKVRLRRDLEVNKRYNGLTLYNSMYKDYYDDVMTIESKADDNYMCKENTYWWGEDMLEKIEETKDNEQVRTVDVGFHLDYCGHKVLENVWQGGWADECEERSVLFTSYDCKNQYTLPLSAINWVIPHED